MDTPSQLGEDGMDGAERVGSSEMRDFASAKIGFVDIKKQE